MKEEGACLVNAVSIFQKSFDKKARKKRKNALNLLLTEYYYVKFNTRSVSTRLFSLLCNQLIVQKEI